MSAADIAAGVRAGNLRATDVITGVLERIAKRPELNAFTDILAERAMARARLPLKGQMAGVPFAVKNLFDIAGVPTRAGSAINRSHRAATRDAALIERLEAAGAILIGAVNMSEYAYDFSGANAHDGTPCNPHDLMRMTGGSSSGSAAAVAGGLVPLALASDTNGSIRIPASFCGLFGLKPTYGRLSRSGTFPLASSFDHLGALARTTTDLALAHDAAQGPADDDPTCPGRIDFVGPQLERGIGDLRIAVASGYFQDGAAPEVIAALQAVARALNAVRQIDLTGASRARAAAYLITASEAAALHLDRLRMRASEFDPAVRDRLIAGALIPASIVVQAQKFRRHFQCEVMELFQTIDVFIAPAAPCIAPRLEQFDLALFGQSLPLRAHLGIYTQPLSFVGLPVAIVPVAAEGMPIGVQIIAAPWREDIVLRVARFLERHGVCTVRRPGETSTKSERAANSPQH